MLTILDRPEVIEQIHISESVLADQGPGAWLSLLSISDSVTHSGWLTDRFRMSSARQMEYRLRFRQGAPSVC